jgi:ATP-binding cassette subfamily F protein 3
MPAEKKLNNNNKSNNNTSINKEQEKELQKAKKSFQQLEENISKLNLEKARLETNLATPEIYLDRQKFADTENRYKQNSDQLNKANLEYETLFEKIMGLEETVSTFPTA